MPAVAPDSRPPLDDISCERWTEWLRYTLARKVIPPPWATAGTELHHGLINVHRSLRDLGIRNAFDDAIAEVFDSFAFSSRDDVIFSLLQLIAYAKPIRAKQVLYRVLFSEHLHRLRIDSYQLHTLALSVASKYTVGDELLGYIDRSVRRSSDLRYLLVCFRARSSVPAARSTDMLQHLIVIARSDAELHELVRELRGFAGFYGYEPLFRWYLENIARMTEDDSANLQIFERIALRDLTGSLIDSPHLNDPYQAGLAAAILSRQRRIDPQEYAAIAQMSGWNHGDVESILEFVWSEQRARGWKAYVSSPEEFERIGPSSAASISIYNEEGEAIISVALWPAATATLQRLDAIASGRPIERGIERNLHAS